MKKVFIIIGCLLLGGLLLFSLKDNWKHNKLLKQEVMNLQKQKSNLEKEQGNLKGLFEKGQKEASLEKEARLMLGLKKEGEKVVMIIPPLTTNQVTTTPEKVISPSLSKIGKFWYNIKALFKRSTK